LVEVRDADVATWCWLEIGLLGTCFVAQKIQEMKIELKSGIKYKSKKITNYTYTIYLMK